MHLQVHRRTGVGPERAKLGSLARLGTRETQGTPERQGTPATQDTLETETLALNGPLRAR
jgi:hypothetical protein